MKRLIKITLVLVLFGVVVSGCKVSKLKVCGTIYPVQFLIQKIGGDRVDNCVISDNSEILRAQISPSFKSDLIGAKILFHIGDLEPFLSMYEREIKNQKIAFVDLANTSAIYKFKRYNYVTKNETTVVVDSDYYPMDAFKDVDMHDVDPYIWLDPIGMTSMGRTIMEQLSVAAPYDKEFFESNFKALENDLVRLDAEYQVVKNSPLKVKFVSVSPSFGAWQKSYGVEVYPLILSKFGVVPNTEQLVVIEQAISDNQVKYLAVEGFTFEDFSSVVSGLKTKYKLTEVELHNLSFISQEDVDLGKDYFTLMYENLDALMAMSK
jgi:zinc transport system substrate-binding protein